jgi:hypothetical protein
MQCQKSTLILAPTTIQPNSGLMYNCTISSSGPPIGDRLRRPAPLMLSAYPNLFSPGIQSF